MKVVPTVCDETKVIDGKVAEDIMMAMSHGNDWFIGGMNGGYAANLTPVNK